MKILLIGAQGSGKSTQARLLAKYLKVPVISTGDIFRSLMQEDAEMGRKLKDILNGGQLVDDQTTCQIVKERLSQSDCQQGFVMDGYPRTLSQIELFDPGFNRVFHLKLTDEEATDRLLKRGRGDDTPEVISQRLRLYHQETNPIINYYKQKNLLSEIDGRGTIEEVQQRIREGLDGRS